VWWSFQQIPNLQVEANELSSASDSQKGKADIAIHYEIKIHF
jgi:hypothetical protein